MIFSRATCLAVTGLFLFFRCDAQGQATDLAWTGFKFSEVKVEASFPCKPEKRVRRGLQRSDPRFFEYRCSSDGTNFSIALFEYFGEVNKDTPTRIADGIEKELRVLVKDADVLRTSVPFQTFVATILDVKGETTLRRYMFVRTQRGLYSSGVQSTRKKDQSQEDFAAAFASVSQKFTDSFKIMSAK